MEMMPNTKEEAKDCTMLLGESRRRNGDGKKAWPMLKAVPLTAWCNRGCAIKGEAGVGEARVDKSMVLISGGERCNAKAKAN
nr:unnamed protein product [Digitaria exilis]